MAFLFQVKKWLDLGKKQLQLIRTNKQAMIGMKRRLKEI